MSKPNHAIIEALGPEAIEARVGVSSHSVRAARAAGTFPAKWFDVIDTMCRENGMDCPRAAFNFTPTMKLQPAKHSVSGRDNKPSAKVNGAASPERVKSEGAA